MSIFILSAKQKKYVSVEEMSVAPFPRSANAVKDDLVINSFTRTWDDTCEVAQNIRDSAGPGAYQVTNLVPTQESAARVEYPNPTLLGREGFGYNNREIDNDSRLRNDATQAGRQRCPLHVQSRPFATVPFMGNGRGNPDVESSLIYAEFARVERPCGTVTETFFDGQFTPLVPHLARHIQNPKNLVPEVASAGWLRGGLPSRQFVRDLNC
jgi:hypothetical protein